MIVKTATIETINILLMHHPPCRYLPYGIVHNGLQEINGKMDQHSRIPHSSLLYSTSLLRKQGRKRALHCFLILPTVKYQSILQKDI